MQKHFATSLRKNPLPEFRAGDTVRVWVLIKEGDMIRADQALVELASKADRTIDVRSYCSSIEHEPGLLRMELRMTEAGTARPDEIAQAVAGLLGQTANIKQLVRTRIRLRPQPVGVHT